MIKYKQIVETRKFWRAGDMGGRPTAPDRPSRGLQM